MRLARERAQGATGVLAQPPEAVLGEQRDQDGDGRRLVERAQDVDGGADDPRRVGDGRQRLAEHPFVAAGGARASSATARTRGSAAGSATIAARRAPATGPFRRSIASTKRIRSSDARPGARPHAAELVEPGGQRVGGQAREDPRRRPARGVELLLGGGDVARRLRRRALEPVHAVPTSSARRCWWRAIAAASALRRLANAASTRARSS